MSVASPSSPKSLGRTRSPTDAVLEAFLEGGVMPHLLNPKIPGAAPVAVAPAPDSLAASVASLSLAGNSIEEKAVAAEVTAASGSRDDGPAVVAKNGSTRAHAGLHLWGVDRGGGKGITGAEGKQTRHKILVLRQGNKSVAWWTHFSVSVNPSSYHLPLSLLRLLFCAHYTRIELGEWTHIWCQGEERRGGKSGMDSHAHKCILSTPQPPSLYP